MVFGPAHLFHPELAPKLVKALVPGPMTREREPLIPVGATNWNTI